MLLFFFNIFALTLKGCILDVSRLMTFTSSIEMSSKDFFSHYHFMNLFMHTHENTYGVVKKYVQYMCKSFL